MDDTHKKLREWWELCKENTIDFSPSDFDWYEEIENFILKPDETNIPPALLLCSACGLKNALLYLIV